MTPADWTPMRHRMRCWSVRNPWAGWLLECAAYLLGLALLVRSCLPEPAYAVTAETAAGDRQIVLWYLCPLLLVMVAGWCWHEGRAR